MKTKMQKFASFLESIGITHPVLGGILEATGEVFKVDSSIGPVYHGSNNIIREFESRDGTGKESIIWFTDDYDYASQQGQHLVSATLKSNNPLTVDALNNLTSDEIATAMQKINNKVDIHFYNTRLKESVSRNIDKFIDGEIPIENIFAGMGGLKTLRNLGFDLYKMKSPYNESSWFYLVLDSIIINILP